MTEKEVRKLWSVLALLKVAQKTNDLEEREAHMETADELINSLLEEA